MNIKDLSELELIKNAIYLIDVDGVMCATYHYEIDKKLTQNEYFNHKLSLSCDIKSVNLIQQLIKFNIEFYFLTGRNIEIKQLTEDMFIKANLINVINKIIYNNNEDKYSLDTFMDHKINQINLFRMKSKPIIVIDDHMLLIDCINYMNFQNLIGIHFNLPYIKKEF